MMNEKDRNEEIRNLINTYNEDNAFGWEIPQVEIGDVIDIFDLWDGDGDNPAECLDDYDTKEGSYSVDFYDEEEELYAKWGVNYVFESLDGRNVRIKDVYKI